jgi:hypothetical protein
MITTPLSGDLALDIGDFVAQVIFNSPPLLIWRRRPQNLHDGSCNHSSTIVRIDTADTAAVVPPIGRGGGKALHLACCLSAIGRLFQQRCQAAE